MTDASNTGETVVVVAEGTTAEDSYGRLTVDVEKCTGCRCCELACSLRNYGECNPSRSRIYVVGSQIDGVITTIPVVCQQCEEALCVTMCPAQALGRDSETHAVVVDAERCLGCRTCVEVCPFGGPSVDPRTGSCEKCTLCEGDPACVKVCSQQALTYLSAEEESIHRKRVGAQRYLEHLCLIASGRE